MLENENVLNENETESVVEGKKGKKSKPKKQKGTIVWSENLKTVFKGIKGISFWGRNKVCFKMEIPTELNDVVEESLELIHNCFHGLEKGRQQDLTKRKFLTLLIMASLGVSENEDGELVSDNRVKKFIDDLNKHTTEEEIQLIRKQRATTYLDNKDKKKKGTK